MRRTRVRLDDRQAGDARPAAVTAPHPGMRAVAVGLPVAGAALIRRGSYSGPPPLGDRRVAPVSRRGGPCARR